MVADMALESLEIIMVNIHGLVEHILLNVCFRLQTAIVEQHRLCAEGLNCCVQLLV